MEADGSGQSPLMDEVPADVHEVIVRILMAQPRRPEALVSLTSTCKQLRAMLPAELQRESARDRVDHTLGVRPTPDELHALGIMPCAPSTSARIAEAQRTLQREMTRAALGSSLTSRKPETDLRRQGILKGSPCVSPKLADMADRLDRQLRRDSLKHSVERRPDADDLRHAGIVKTPAVLSARLAETADMLERRLMRDSLVHGLERRRSLGELTSTGILKPWRGTGGGASQRVLGGREALERQRLKASLDIALEARPPTLRKMEEQLAAKGLIDGGGLDVDAPPGHLLRQCSAPPAVGREVLLRAPS